MAEFKQKELYVKFEGSSVDAKYGGMVMKADVKKVTDAFTSVVGVVGPENCLKLVGGLGILATSLYAIKKLVSRYFPGLEVNEVKEGNCLQVAVPEKHVARFEGMVADGRLTKKLKNDFEDLETTLVTILGDDQYEKVGKSVLELIENVRIDSISSRKDSNPNAVGKIIEGTAKDTVVDKRSLVAAGKGGHAVGEHIKAGAHAEHNIKGGVDCVVAGIGGEDLKQITDSVYGDRIKLTIRGPDLSEKFEGKFKPTDTIADVIEELRKMEKKTFRIFRNDEQLDENTTMAQIEQNGTVLRAVI